MTAFGNVLAACLLLSMIGCDTLLKQGVADLPPAPESPDDFKIELASPDPESERGRALAALPGADQLVILSLQPWSPTGLPKVEAKYGTPEYHAQVQAQSEAWKKSQAEWCKRDKCLDDNLVLGSTAITRGADHAMVMATLKEALAQVPNYASACAPAFRHAIAFESQGKAFQALLCFECGQVVVSIDGVFGPVEQAFEMRSEDKLNAMLAAAGVPLSKE